MAIEPFHVKDCNLALIATGEVAESLIELRDLLYRIPSSSLYYHFWGARLRTSFIQYHNDFARWAHFGLNDDILTERLSIIDPTEYPDLEDLRIVVVDILEDRLEEVQLITWSRNESKFHFLRSIIIVYDSGYSISVPSDLKEIIPKFTPSSIFYHFIDAKRRTSDKSDDFSLWLSSFDQKFTELIKKIKLIDSYFLSLTEIKQQLADLFNQYL